MMKWASVVGAMCVRTARMCLTPGRYTTWYALGVPAFTPEYGLKQPGFVLVPGYPRVHTQVHLVTVLH